MKPVESQVEEVVAQVFDRLPVLVGFSVQVLDPVPEDRSAMQLENELFLADVETFPWAGRYAELVGEIALPLLELIDEEPAARQLLSGRTFARTLQ